ncbi:MAG: 4-hydroxybenzoyl-CoA thioesterase [Gammaproteobacteria bacterium]|nr:MAG: 4-hydroxybenzoyl-CoA thioesterase [Gammaproteobacteria bacterium]
MQKDNNFSPITINYPLRVPFYDIDAMHIVWHGHYVKYFEDARCTLLDSIGYNYMDMEKSGYGWPVIDLRIQYVRPLKFGQEIIIKAALKDIEYGLHIGYNIVDKNSGQRLTKGYSKQIAVALDSGEMLLCSPDVLYEKISRYRQR